MRSARTVGTPLLAASLAWAACGGGTPTSPSALKEEVKVKDATFRVARTFFWRDFMPIVVNPGPDGGGPLQGSVYLLVTNDGKANSFTVTASVYDAAGTRYSVTAVVHDYEREASGQEVVWNGSLGPGANRALEVRLTSGPYVAVGSRLFAVLEWRDSEGHTGSLRTPDTEVTGTA